MWMCLHCQQENIQSASHVPAALVPDDPHQVVEDTLHDGGPVEISPARHQDLPLLCVPGDDAGWDVVPAAGLCVCLVQSEELQRIVLPVEDLNI